MKKYKKIVILAIIVLAVIATSTVPLISYGDKFWNFANTYKLYNGISLYNENNVIITPLFFWIGNIFFKIFGANFFVHQIYHFVMLILLYIQLYKLIKKCGIKDSKAIIICVIMALVLKSINIVGANYSVLALLLILIGVNNILKNQDKKVNVIFQSIIASLVFLTKQNMGTYYIIALFIYLITSKDKLKNIIKFIVTMGIQTVIFVGYEILNNELYNFINYTFLGISEFAQRNIVLETVLITKIMIIIQIVAIVVAIYQFKINKKDNIKDEKLKVLFIFSIADCLTDYPIFNRYHVTVGSVIPIVLLIYIVLVNVKKITIEEDAKEALKNTFRIITIFIGIVLGINILMFAKNLLILKKSEAFIEDYSNPFFGGIMDKAQELEYDEVMEFIKEKDDESKVIIFDYRANLYMVPLKRNNQNYDLPMLGNWGKDGENKVLNDIKSTKNTYFLICEEEKNITIQESVRIKEYIRENMKLEKNIGKYEVYYKQ